MTEPAVPGMEEIRAVASAMELRRRELINEPLARIWDQLAEAAVAAMNARRFAFGPLDSTTPRRS